MKISSLNIFESSDQVAWVGAGGKTSLIFSIAKEIFSERCVISTTTKMSVDELRNADVELKLIDPNSVDVAKISNITLVYHMVSDFDHSKVIGFSEFELRSFSRNLREASIPFFIEADGSKRKSFKFPAEHEPNIPEFVNKVCVVVGLSVVGKPLTSEFFHRIDEISAFLNVPVGEIITLNHIYQILIDKNGGLKNIPKNSKKILFLNQSDCAEDLDTINKFALKLKNVFDHVLLSHYNNGELEIMAHWGKIGCVILAAGTGSRFGGPKQLALFQNKTFIQQVIESATQVPFDKVSVILGAYAKQISSFVKGYEIEILINEKWQEGQSSSVRMGIEYFSKMNLEAAVFLLVDQPQISSELIMNILNNYAYLKPDVLVHDFNGQTRHPILFSKKTFEKLLHIDGAAGGRQIFNQFEVYRIKLTDPKMAIDIDTLEDLQEFNEQ